MDELENSISVKISKEAVMSINSPESLFTPVNGIVETKVYIAGLPERADIIKPVSSFNAPSSPRWRPDWQFSATRGPSVFTPSAVRSTLVWTAASGRGT